MSLKGGLLCRGIVIRMADKLSHYNRHPKAIVLALPRGGVPVGFAVSRSLGLPFEIFIVRKIGIPGHEEIAIGAVASGGIRILNKDIIERFGLSDEAIALAAVAEQKKLERRESLYRGDRFLPDLKGRIAIMVDDGMATGATMAAAARAMQAFGLKRLVVAVPVAGEDAYRRFENEVDEIVAIWVPKDFQEISQWYREFPQLSDEQVLSFLPKSDGVR
jgi:putative phosphoribosyl transferase